MESSQGSAQAAARANRPREDWNDDDFVHYWLDGQDARMDERHHQFAMIRALMPKLPTDEFRYIDLGAGGGHLEEVLLDHFPNASATLVDTSTAMLAAAKERLARFENRVDFVQGDFTKPDWAAPLSGPYDFAVSSIAIHNLRDPNRIRALYAETYKLLGHGGMLINLDYVRPPKATLTALATWAGKDPEAGISPRSGGNGMPGTVAEQMIWLTEAGFAAVDVPLRDMGVAVMCAVRDHLHIPERGEGGHAPGEAH